MKLLISTLIISLFLAFTNAQSITVQSLPSIPQGWTASRQDPDPDRLLNLRIILAQSDNGAEDGHVMVKADSDRDGYSGYEYGGSVLPSGRRRVSYQHHQVENKRGDGEQDGVPILIWETKYDGRGGEEYEDADEEYYYWGPSDHERHERERGEDEIEREEQDPNDDDGHQPTEGEERETLESQAIIAWLHAIGVPSSLISSHRRPGSVDFGMTLSEAEKVLETTFLVYRQQETGREVVGTLGYRVPKEVWGFVARIESSGERGRGVRAFG